MFNKLKDHITRPDKTNKTSAPTSGRTRTSSTASRSSQLSSGATELEPSSVVHMSDVDSFSRDPLLGDDSDSASIISFCPSECEKAEFHTRFQRVYQLAQNYKSKFKHINEAYGRLQAERDQLLRTVESGRTNVYRRVAELQEQVELDKKAKQDVEMNYNLILHEKDELIRVLRLQITLLKEGCTCSDLSPELEEKINASHEEEVRRQRSMEQENQELKAKLQDLMLQLHQTTTKFEEQAAEREQLERTVGTYEARLEQFSSLIAERDQLRRDLANSCLIQSSLEEQVNVLKSELIVTNYDHGTLTALTPSTKGDATTTVVSDQQFCDMTEHVERLRVELSVAQSDRDALSQKLSECHCTQHGICDSSAQQTTTHAYVEKSSHDTADQLSASNAELDKVLRREIAVVEQLEEARSHTIQKELECSQLQSQLLEFRETKSEYHHVRNELESLTRQIQDIEHKIWNKITQPNFQSLFGSSFITQAELQTCPSLESAVNQLLQLLDVVNGDKALQLEQETKLKTLQNDLCIEQANAAEMTRLLDVSVSQLSETRDQLNTLLSKFEQSERILDNKEDVIAELSNNFSQLCQDHNQTVSRCEILEQEKLAHASAFASLEADRNDLRDKFTQLLNTVQSPNIVSGDKLNQMNTSEAHLLNPSLLADQLSALHQHLRTLQIGLNELKVHWVSIAEEALKPLGEEAVRLFDHLEQWYTEICEHWSQEKEDLQVELRQSQERCVAAENCVYDIKAELSVCEHNLSQSEIHVKELLSDLVKRESELQPQALQQQVHQLVDTVHSKGEFLVEDEELVQMLEDALTKMRGQLTHVRKYAVVDQEQQTDTLPALSEYEVSALDLPTQQMDETVLSARTKLSSLEELLHTCEQRLTSAEDVLETIQAQQLSMNSGRVQTLEEQLVQSESRLVLSQQTNTQLDQELGNLKTHLSSLHSQLSESHTSVRMLQDANKTNLQAVLERLFDTFRTRTKWIREVRSETGQPLFTDVSQVGQGLQSLERNLDDAMSELLNLVHLDGGYKVIPALLERLATVQHRLDDLEQVLVHDHNRLYEAKQQTCGELHRLTQELTAMCMVRDQLQQQLHDVTVQLNHLRESHVTSAQRVHGLERSLDEAHAHSSEVESQLAHLKMSMEAKEHQWFQQIALLEEDLQRTKSSLHDSSVTLCEKESQFVTLATQLSDLTALRSASIDGISQLVSAFSDTFCLRASLVREQLNHVEPDVAGALLEQLESIEHSVCALQPPDLSHPSDIANLIERIRTDEARFTRLSTQLDHLHLEHEARIQERRIQTIVSDETQRMRQQLSQTEAQVANLTASLNQALERHRQAELLSQDQINEMDTQMHQVLTRIAQQDLTLMEKSDLVLSLELQMQEFRGSHEAVAAKLVDKDNEIENLNKQIEGLNDQLYCALNDVEHLRLQCAELHEKLSQSDRLVDEQRQQSQEDEARFVATESASMQRVKQLKQQLFDTKGRLKQLLLESENTRKAMLSATAREKELTSLLKQTQEDLVLLREQGNELRERNAELENRLETMRQTEVLLTQSIAKQNSRSTSIDEIRETYQNETEHLKADYAEQMHKMQTQFERQKTMYESALRAEFENNLECVRNAELQSHQFELQTLHQRIEEADAAKELLHSRVKQLEAEVADLQTHPTTDNAVTQVDEGELQLSRPTCPNCSRTDPSMRPLSVDTSAEVPDVTQSITGTGTLTTVPLNETSVPLAHLQLARPTGWVTQLRNEIMQSESIESLHPAIRSTHYANTVSQADYEALQLHNADLQTQLHQLASEFEDLRSHCQTCNPNQCASLNDARFDSRHNSVSVPYSPVTLSPLTGSSLQQIVEYEYLKNVLFEYMLGRETSTLAKVLCSIMRFNPDQTRRVLQHENSKSRIWTLEAKLE